MGARRGRFVERTITGALSFIKESIFADEYASSRGFLQARDPRLKAAAIFALLLAVLLSREIAPIACIYALCLLLAAVSSIGIPYFLKRTWFFVPLFSLCIAAPALFSIFTPGEALISVTIFSFNLAITKQGVAGAGIFFLRILTSVSLCVLLSLTTRHQRLLGALRAFRVPQVFVMTLGMCHRYVYSFIELIQNSHLAIKSRSGGVRSPSMGRRMVAWNISTLWRRSYDLHGRVFQAMISRGYRGEPLSMDDDRVTAADILCLGAAILILAGGIWRARFSS